MSKFLKVSGVALVAALLTTLPAAAVTLNLGGGGGLLGGSGTNTDATAAVDGGLVNGGNEPTTANVNIGGSGGADAATLLDLFGPGNQSSTADVTLGGGDGTSGNAAVDLFGNGSGSGSNSNARIALGNGGLGTGGVGTDPALDLFGPSDNGGAGAPGSGSNGGNGGGISGNARTVGTVQIAAAGQAPANGKCFTPTAEQEAKLLARHDYSQTTASWGQVAQIKVIDVGLCDTAAKSLVSQANIADLQSYVSAHPQIRAGLDKLGRSPGEVIAGDKSGDTLTLYVM